jgi:hypothetical protein
VGASTDYLLGWSRDKTGAEMLSSFLALDIDYCSKTAMCNTPASLRRMHAAASVMDDFQLVV